ncbi:MAG: nitronate monooxygenase [Coriobacteriia bacterium]|nr:nitronate monooxygenase [Coriobacteriia bacterium]
MDIPSLTIGSRTARLPVVQGGMAVRISLSPLAAAVARAGGVGLIAGTGLTADELAAEVRAAREVTDGVIGVNIMVAVRSFKELVHAAIDSGADLIVAGAGFSRDMFGWCRDAGVECVPIVGSARVARLSEKFGASAVVVEGVDAGGHLGTDRSIDDLLPEILEAVDIPVIAAGGIVTGADIKRMLDAGAAGVQMGSRFVVTVECSAPDVFKQLYVNASADEIVLTKSPVGLPGRAIRNPFTERLAAGDYPRIERCVSCLKQCGKEYCIMDALQRSQSGDVVDGLVFAGTSAARITEILAVQDLMDRLVAEWLVASGEE